LSSTGRTAAAEEAHPGKRDRFADADGGVGPVVGMLGVGANASLTDATLSWFSQASGTCFGIERNIGPECEAGLSSGAGGSRLRLAIDGVAESQIAKRE